MNNREDVQLFPNIRIEKVRRKLTNEDLGKIIGCSSNSVSMKLCGKRQFTLKEIERLADFFECSLDYLVGRNTISP